MSSMYALPVVLGPPRMLKMLLPMVVGMPKLSEPDVFACTKV